MYLKLIFQPQCNLDLHQDKTLNQLSSTYGCFCPINVMQSSSYIANSQLYLMLFTMHNALKNASWAAVQQRISSTIWEKISAVRSFCGSEFLVKFFLSFIFTDFCVWGSAQSKTFYGFEVQTGADIVILWHDTSFQMKE